MKDIADIKKDFYDGRYFAEAAQRVLHDDMIEYITKKYNVPVAVATFVENACYESVLYDYFDSIDECAKTAQTIVQLSGNA